MKSSIITNYTDVTFLATIQSNLRSCSSFCFSVSFIKKAVLDLLKNDIAAAVERGAKGKYCQHKQSGKVTSLYDMQMHQKLPDYLMDDFKWIA